jgi:hypothetical protein
MMRLNIRVAAPIPLVKVETPEPAKGEITCKPSRCAFCHVGDPGGLF